MNKRIFKKFSNKAENLECLKRPARPDRPKTTVLLSRVVRFVGHYVSYVVPRVAVKSLLQPTLIQEMTDETHAPSQHEETEWKTA